MRGLPPIRQGRRVLVIDGEPARADSFAAAIAAEGCDVRTALRGAQGLAAFQQWRPDIVLMSLLLPDVDGVVLLRQFKRLDPQPEIIVTGAEGSTARSIEAGQAGAFYFLEQPVSQDGVVEIVRRAFARVEERSDHRRLKEHVQGRGSFANIIGHSQSMQDLFAMVERVADSDANILIEGENGTGKELIANAVHDHSRRADGPFIKINCAAIPKDLIESELFGYRKGAFTGATVDKVGLFELAEGGSLLLDEIGEMPAYLQTKLLRVLQEREFRPIGSERLVRVDFRLICATNVDLVSALRDGRVREDLYFRINTIAMRVPPLRERTEDIPLLCTHFLATFNRRYDKQVRSLSPAAHRLLLRHRWTGNVRELENVIERAVLVCKGGECAPDDLPDTLRDAAMPTEEFRIPPHRTLAEIEKMAIVQTLQRTNWNKQEAAQLLGLYRPTLYSKMKKYDIRDERAQRRPSPEPS